MNSKLSRCAVARTVGALAFASLLGLSVFAETPDNRIRSAADSFQEIMRVPEKGIPRDLLDKAECVVIIPRLKKGAFLVGGKYGRGFVSCRRRSDRWGPPAGVRIEGGSYGFQIGGSSTDVFMLIMNEKGMKSVLVKRDPLQVWMAERVRALVQLASCP